MYPRSQSNLEKVKLQKEIDTNLLMDLTDNIPHTLTQHGGAISLKSFESEFKISHTHFEMLNPLFGRLVLQCAL